MPKKSKKAPRTRNDRPAAVKKPRSSGRPSAGFWRLFVSTPMRQILLVAIVTGLLYWQWPAITAAADSLVAMFGWGLLLLGLAAVMVLAWIWRKRVTSFFWHFNRWLGGAAFILAAWGVLAFFDFGGSFGRDIISYRSPEFIGLLRVGGLALTGIILVAPRACFRMVAGFFAWAGKQFESRPAQPRPQRQQPATMAALDRADRERMKLAQRLEQIKASAMKKPPLPAEAEKPVAPPEAGMPKTPLTVPPKEPVVESPAGSARQDLRQVADEVWKKYGQSPDLVMIDGWRLPPVDILDVSPEIEFSDADNVQRAGIIEEALSSYGVEAKVVQINAGPTVTQFGLEPGWDRKYKEVKEKDRDGNTTVTQKEVSRTRVKVDRITSLANDLALALAAPSIRIEAPIPGKPVVGVEVPNTTVNMVSLRGVVETNTFQKTLSKSKLAVALGKGAGGETVAADLAKMPHLLVAGATGSGKTVCLNAIICCLLLNNTPNDLRLILVDPKRVELTPYNSIPHLASAVIVDSEKALGVLRWLSNEMGERYKKLAAEGARNIEGFNKNKEGDEKLPYLVLVIDELADLMMTGFDEVEGILCRLAQLARAVGIHLIVATQRPSVDVVTGLIKANFPTRISFAVTSQVDSRTILDSVGAEKLLGKGDMLYMPTEAGKPKRLQGCFLSDAEMERLVYFWSSQQREEADKLKLEEIALPAEGSGGEEYPKDPLLDKARELAQQHEHISTSFLQRRLHIGYPRAARIMEQLEEEMGQAADEEEAAE